MENLQTIYWYLFAIPSLIIAATVHEYAHAFVATKFGDYTAKSMGRMTLNPLSHIDPLGAIMLIIVGFGWSKPIPINEYNFQKPILHTALTAAAGPISNFILAILSAGIYHLYPNTFIIVFMIINLSLATFNLLPIPPFDGHKIVRALLPKKLRYYWEKFERLIPFIFLLFVIPFSPLSKITQSIISGAIEFFFKILRII